MSQFLWILFSSEVLGFGCSLTWTQPQQAPGKGKMQPHRRPEAWQRHPCEAAKPRHPAQAEERNLARLTVSCQVFFTGDIIKSVGWTVSGCAHHVMQKEERTTRNVKGTRVQKGRERSEKDPSLWLPPLSPTANFFFCLLQSKLSIQWHTNREGGGKPF